MPSWKDVVRSGIASAAGPSGQFSLPGLYQSVKKSPEFLQMNPIKDVDATVRNVVNGMVKTGEIERLGEGRYRRNK
jgi:hypothetical protein